MLKALIVDGSAIARGLLNTVLVDGGYEVVAQAHTGLLGYGLAMKHRPQIVCIAREQVEDGSRVVEELRIYLPKAMLFMVSGTLDAAAIQDALGRGVHGFIVKPFKADTVLKTIRNTVIAVVKKQGAPGNPA
jgi:two-component system chemotaxis response regulator CheY